MRFIAQANDETARFHHAVTVDNGAVVFEGDGLYAKLRVDDLYLRGVPSFTMRAGRVSGVAQCDRVVIDDDVESTTDLDVLTISDSGMLAPQVNDSFDLFTWEDVWATGAGKYSALDTFLCSVPNWSTTEYQDTGSTPRKYGITVTGVGGGA